jgi:hypothetical protein
MSVDHHTIERFDMATRRLEKVADLGAIAPSAPMQTPWMGLDHLDRPLVIHSAGIEDLYVVDWEAP